MVTTNAFYSIDHGLNPAEANSFFKKIVFGKNKNKRKRGQQYCFENVAPFKTILCFDAQKLNEIQAGFG